jgi:D-sedoheptulose 7-phosphate isomerase
VFLAEARFAYKYRTINHNKGKTIRGLLRMNYSEKHTDESIEILKRLDTLEIEKVVKLIADLRERQGRLFFLGVGGSAANCSHAVNDFRKLCGIEAYAPVDNVSELTARTNDEGWASVFVEWLKVSRLSFNDMLFVMSVGGGNLQKNISPNLVYALQYAIEVGAKVVGIVGRDGGYTAVVANACVIIPTVNPESITPHSEAFQGVVWHLLVSHPDLKLAPTKWESTR